MKNLDPMSGLRQVATGYLYLPRKMILNLIKDQRIKPIDLGYFIIFLISTDWDRNTHRFGFMRHEIKQLAKIWNVPYPTLQKQLNSLIDKGLMSKDLKVPKIINFNSFTQNGARTMNEKLSDQELKTFFPNLLVDYQIRENSKSNNTYSFTRSSKGELVVHDAKGNYTDAFIKDVEDSIYNAK